MSRSQKTITNSNTRYKALVDTHHRKVVFDVGDQVNYGDGSYTVGNFATESVSFGNSGSVKNVALGCGHYNEGLFVGAAGLLGLGGGPLSLTNQLKATSFSYCLVNRNSAGSSTLDFNSVPLGGDSVTAPLMKNRKIDTFYYVGLSGMSVGGQMVSIPESVFRLDASGNGGIIVDSGTAITRLQTQAYNPLRDAFAKMTQNLERTSAVALFDTCYDLSGQTSVRVPTVSFHFTGGKSWNLPAANYLVPVDSAGTFCFAFAPTTSSLSIIGNVQQQGTRVTFDLANSRMGFSPNKCTYHLLEKALLHVNEGPHHGGLFPSTADVHKVWEIVNHFPILPIDEVVSSSDAVREATSLHSYFDAKIRLQNELFSSFQNEIANTALLGLAFSPPVGQKLRRFFDVPTPTLEFRASISHPLLDSN
ncbi:protein ASPARTIC PROTEASE IN GUARD CELL [Salix suchowensis]|nr:protein ASPARTIC PROTEASE IN GUARD CELL [Salix suchowensis]